MRRMTDQRGFASVTALVVMMVMLVVAAAVFESSVQLSNSSNKDDAAQRAYQAAVSGVNTAVDRVERNKVALAGANTCLTTTVVSLGVSGWCAETAQESLGRNQLFSYRVSTSPPPSGNPNCAGDPLGANSGERCIIAVGVVNGVERTVAARMGIAGSSTPFANNTSVVGYKDVKLKTNAKVNSNIGVNKKLTLDRNALLTGTADLGPKAKVKYRTAPGPLINRKATDSFPAPVSFLTVPPTSPAGEDTAGKNRNMSIQITSPTTYTQDPVLAGNRVLTVAAGKSVTLSGSGKIDPLTGFPEPAYYNFCKLILGTGSKVVVAPGAWVRLYIDSRDRQGSRCSNIGELKAGKDSSFSTPTKDPRALQIFAWSKKSKLTIPNKSDIYAAIYAPFSKVKFSNKGKLYGGVAGQTVEIRKDMQVFSVPLALNAYSVSTLNAPAITAWKQCQAYKEISTSPTPAADC